MYSYSLQLIIGICLFWGIFLCNAQSIRQCEAGTRCIRTRSCSLMVDLVKSGSPENIRRVREAICGFQRTFSLVCCPISEGENPPTTTENQPFQIGQNLLPALCGRPFTGDKIFGGAPAPIGAYPWVAAMGYEEPGVRNFQFVCSGSVINSKYIVTAAHCVDRGQLGRKRLAVIHLGDWDLSTPVDCEEAQLGKICSPPHIVAGYEDIIIHPQYNTRGRSSDDIALIRLNITLDFSVDNNAGRNPVAAGWGLTEHGNNSNVLLRVDVPVVEDSQCIERYRSNFVGNQLCVGGEGGTDTCTGDSGGPLILSEDDGPPYTLIGIVSFGPFPCGIQRFPGVYTSVSHYKDWIMQNLRP